MGAVRVRWIVDPIDGTVNYLYSLPQWAVSIAAEVDGVVEAGVVLDPSKGELFTALRGVGAWLNGAPIVVSGCTELSQALVGTGFGYDARRRAAVRLRLGAGHSETDLIRDVARHTGRPETEIAALVGSQAPDPTHDHDLIRLATDLAGLDREVRRT